jgi:hypothetical protein
MSKGIPSCLHVITDSNIKLRVSEELTYLGPMNAPTLIFSILTLRKFSNKNKMLGHFYLVP